MQKIVKDVNLKYKKLKLDYTFGINKIYLPQEIEKKKVDVEFEREYNLKYLGKIGNVFSPLLIDRTVRRFDELNLSNIPIIHEALHLVGIDPAFGSSNTAIVITEHLKDSEIIRVIYTEFEKANPQDIVDLCYEFHRKYYPNIILYQSSLLQRLGY